MRVIETEKAKRMQHKILTKKNICSTVLKEKLKKTGTQYTEYGSRIREHETWHKFITSFTQKKLHQTCKTYTPNT